MRFPNTSNEHFDVTIVGSGPSGLFAAHELQEKAGSPLKILVVDKGGDYGARYCPVINGAKCISCNPCCMACGMGGAGLFLGAKLSFYPAGTGLERICRRREEVLELHEYSKKAFIDLGAFESQHSPSTRKIAEITERAEKLGIYFKYYPVESLSPRRTYAVITNLRKKCNRAIFSFFANALSIDLAKNGQWAVVLENQKGERRNITCEFLVLGPGKAGTRWLHRQAEKLNLKREHNPIEIGVRLEMPRRVLKSATEVHKDLKLILKMGEAEARTFCVCDGGKVAICKYEETLVGGKIAKTRNTNFALLVRKKLSSSADPLYYAFSLARRINKRTKNGILVQRLGDFINGRPSTMSAISDNKVKSTLSLQNLAVGNIIDSYPPDVIEGLRTALSRINDLIPGVSADENLLYAPEVELCWDRFSLDSNMQTNMDGLYITGDVCGHIRGIVPSAITGILAARGILKKVS